MRRFGQNTSLILISITVAFLIIEFGSRLIMPIAPGVRYVDADGNAAVLGATEAYRLERGTFRQIAAEFDAKVTITEEGYRVPSAKGNPQIIFVGDSFTFGQGLTDDETFAAIYCKAKNISCANLGQNGLGTATELDVLEHFLDQEKWRPKQVWIFMLAMSGALMSGNDLFDNLNYAPTKKVATTTASKEASAQTAPQHPTNPVSLQSVRRKILASSNFARIGYFFFAPMLRAKFSPEPDGKLFDQALRATEIQFNRFVALSDRYNFQPRLYVLHPMQDLIRGSAQQTLEVVRSIAPATLEVVSTFRAIPQPVSKYYYAYDGHFNAAGAKAFARHLLEQPNKKPEDSVGND